MTLSHTLTLQYHLGYDSNNHQSHFIYCSPYQRHEGVQRVLNKLKHSYKIKKTGFTHP